MSENIGNLYVRADSEEEFNNGSEIGTSKSSTLSSLRNLRDTFKRYEIRASQYSLNSTSTHTHNNESINSNTDTNAPPALKLCKCSVFFL